MAEDIIISSGVVSSGIELDAFMTVLSGGTAVNTVVSGGGSLCVLNGGTADNTTVLSGGELTVYIGGTATNIIENGGCVLLHDGALGTFAPNTIHGLQLMDDGSKEDGYVSATIHSGTTANKMVISDAVLEIFSGGMAVDTVISGGGETNVLSGGTANHTTISSGGTLCIRSGATLNGAIVSRGAELLILSGGNATEITEKGGYVRVNSGALASFAPHAIHDRQLMDFGKNTAEIATVHSGTTAESITVCKSGKLEVCSGASVKDLAVSGGGFLYVSSGGNAERITVSSGGFLYVERGGTARMIRAEKGANVLLRSISPDTYMQGTFAGKSFEVNGVISGCVLIKRGAFDDHDDVGDSPFAEGDTITVFSGGSAVNVTVSSGGELIVSSGGIAKSPIVCDGGLLVVHSGGTALDLKKEVKAEIRISDGAVVTCSKLSTSPRKEDEG